MKKLLTLLALLYSSAVFAASNCAIADFSMTIPAYTSIQPLTSTVLTANLRDDYVTNPLHVKYKVVTNIPENTLYLTTKSLVDGSYEHSMFEHGGRGYIALTSITNQASLQNLTEAKYNLKAPNVLVLPIINVTGADNRIKRDKYEISIKNGVYYIDLNVGVAPPIRGNKNGVYQATVYLTESEI